MKRLKPVVQVLGPTGVGKSGLAVYISEKLNGEVISADSVQVYKGFDIGSSKISLGERKGITHYLIDILEPPAQFNVNQFLTMAGEAVRNIEKKGKIPVVCGGTALYLRAMTMGIFEESGRKRISRNQLKRIADSRGLHYLFQRLSRIDPGYASKIGNNDRIRILRGLEIYYNNGIPPGSISSITSPPFPDNRFIRIGLHMEREEMYRRIDRRVDHMMREGLKDEVAVLREKYPSDSGPMRSIGYLELNRTLNGELELSDAVALIKQHSRNFAKRQMSWFRSEKDIHWFHPDETDRIIRHLRREIDG